MPNIWGAHSLVACGSGSFPRQPELPCQQSYFGQSSTGLGLSLAGSRASLGCSAFPQGQAIPWVGAGGESTARRMLLAPCGGLQHLCGSIQGPELGLGNVPLRGFQAGTIPRPRERGWQQPAQLLGPGCGRPGERGYSLGSVCFQGRLAPPELQRCQPCRCTPDPRPRPPQALRCPWDGSLGAAGGDRSYGWWCGPWRGGELCPREGCIPHGRAVGDRGPSSGDATSPACIPRAGSHPALRRAVSPRGQPVEGRVVVVGAALGMPPPCPQPAPHQDRLLCWCRSATPCLPGKVPVGFVCALHQLRD